MTRRGVAGDGPDAPVTSAAPHGVARGGAAASGPLLQVDVIKGLAIMAVVILHSVPKPVLYQTAAVFHVWQAVPVFCVLMGFTGRLSMRRRAAGAGRGLGAYLGARALRLGIPLTIAFTASLALGAAGLTAREPRVGWLSLLGYLPTPGPGNYFITLLLQFVLLFPFIGRLYAARPGWTVAGCFGVDLAFQLAAPHVAAFQAVPYLYSGSVFRYLGAIALGLWLADDPGPGAPRNRFLWAGLAVSVAFLAAFVAKGYLVPWFVPQWKAQNLVAAFYPAVLVMLGLRFLPAAPGGTVARALAGAGRASYHVFLFQILYFAAGASLVPHVTALAGSGPGLHPGLLAAGTAANVAVCVVAGWALWRAERRLTARARVRAARA